MSISKAKYRPVLTAKQILHILTLAKTESPSISAASLDVISSLAPFQAKIANAGIVPAYTLQPVKPSNTSLEGLGGTSTTIPTTYSSKQELWAASYAKFKQSPVECSLEEIEEAKEHMYLNDLMSPAELEEFEKGNIIGVKSNE